jgi:aspartyl-tRNA(Asn)/glutamyl-tRNA(Gln) amidotransferase subunit A
VKEVGIAHEGGRRREFLLRLGLGPLLASSRSERAWAGPRTNVPVDSLASTVASPPPTIRELAREIRKGAVSPVEIVRDCLARIERLHPSTNAFITVLGDTAVAEARAAERELRSGTDRGVLHGIPIGLKDIVDTAGIRTTAASAQYKDRVPDEDAEIVRRLRAAGAVIVGKQNLHEFAYGGSSIVSFFGPVRNPWDLACIAGGSSGGSAAAVAAGLGYASIGTDTGGSIRQPAACCGVVGLKPTYGRVSTRGVVPLSWSQDHVGPITASVDDAAVLLQAIAGYDALDPASQDFPATNFTAALDGGAAGLRVGVPRAVFFDDLHPEVAAAVERAIDVLVSLRAEIRPIALDVPSDRTLLGAEAFAVHEPLVARSPDLYQPATLARIRSAAETSAAAALRARRDLEARRHAIRRVFEEVDVLLTPTTPAPAPAIADLEAHMDTLRAAEIRLLRNTRPFNIWGIPAITVPCGFTKAALPIGLQLAAAPGREDVLLRAAQAYERETTWRTARPAIAAG